MIVIIIPSTALRINDGLALEAGIRGKVGIMTPHKLSVWIQIFKRNMGTWSVIVINKLNTSQFLARAC